MQHLKQLLSSNAAAKPALPYFEAMAAFVALQKRCFSTKIHPDGYNAQLGTFKAACLRLPIAKMPLKMHIIVAHVDRALRESRRGLGADSEKALEGAHHDFQIVWERFRVRDMRSSVYSQRLLRAVCAFNSSRIPLLRT